MFEDYLQHLDMKYIHYSLIKKKKKRFIILPFFLKVVPFVDFIKLFNLNNLENMTVLDLLKLVDYCSCVNIFIKVMFTGM